MSVFARSGEDSAALTNASPLGLGDFLKARDYARKYTCSVAVRTTIREVTSADACAVVLP